VWPVLPTIDRFVGHDHTRLRKSSLTAAARSGASIARLDGRAGHGRFELVRHSTCPCWPYPEMNVADLL